MLDTYTIGGPTYQMDTRIPPSVPCPTCGAILTVTDDMCYRCERSFHSRELWELWEAHEAGIREARANHYR
jgi:hypothetical protein